MEIQNASTASSKSNQLQNVNAVRWESWNGTLTIGNPIEAIVFVLNAGMNVTANNFNI